MTIILYGAPGSAPYRAVQLTARAIGVDIQKKEVDMQKMEHRAEEYVKLNPTHTIPTMDDNGLLIWESRAIMAYLVQRYGKDDALYPKDPVKRALVDNMLYFDATCLYASAGQYYFSVMSLNFNPEHRQQDPPLSAPRTRLTNGRLVKAITRNINNESFD